ncbi:hypothetical protein GCM10010168_40020 [Actinoplanes ianthinogenes]|uniref:Uncharacterized protein n=1 Tax=Actinoplanes ianthinogenes TaxID=122358 RepID=A0ABM7LWM0_9ACTN|nr:hypothetical protein Aiant_43460 [Actinoplanes ianthinogenes]GGR18324.1 hypothetical protein GCM10010168_40020 [Actinoplanes ianthinogenes]
MATLGVGPLGSAALAAGSAAGSETVVPAAARAVPRATQVLNAGETGFLWIQEGDDHLLWTEYATGVTTTLAQRLSAPVKYDIDNGYFSFLEQSFQSFRVADTHTDTLALHYATPAPHVTLTRGGQTTTVDIPAGQQYQRVSGETVVTTDASGTWHLLKDGTDTPVTGLPADAAEFSVETADASDFILRYRSGGETHFSIVKVATAAATPLPDRYDGSAEDWEVSAFRLTPHALIRLRTGRGALDVYDRADLTAAPRTVDSSLAYYSNVFGVTGSTLLAVEPVSASSGDHRGRELWARAVAGTDASMSVVMNPAAGEMTQLPDGSVLVAGAEKYLGEGDLDWGFYRVAQAADGTLTRTRVAGIAAAPARVYGLSLGSGILTRATSGSYYHPGDQLGTYQSSWLGTGGNRDIVKSSVDGYVAGRDGDCSTDGPRCVRMVADGTGLHGREAGTYDHLTTLLANGSTAAAGPSVDTRLSSPRLTDLSGRWGVVRSGVGGEPYLVEFPGVSTAKSTKQNATATAVWGSLVWNGTANGTVQAGNGEGFSTTNDCAPSAVQAVGRFVYYACDYGAGVYDRITKGVSPAPTGEVLLGDGYLVQATQADGLQLFDLVGKTNRVLVPASELPMFARAGYDWTVDRFGGGVAYADAGERVHVLNTGIPASALTTIDSVVTAGRATWWLSKPAASWTLTLRTSAGATVRTLTGSEARGLITASWADAGVAGWTLTAQPADGEGTALTLSGGTPAPANPALRATRAPAISGTVAVGNTLRAAVGTWTPAPTGYTYRWTANGVAIKGATSAYLPVTASLVGKRLSVTVTASRAGHPSGTATSAATGAVAKGKAPRATTRPKVSGTAKVGRKVKVSVGAWSPRADSYRYEWRVGGKLVGTGKTLKLTRSMRGKKLTVTVIARKTGYLDGRSTSKTVTVKR